MKAARWGHTETVKALRYAKTKKLLKFTCHKIAIPIIFGLGAFLLSRYNSSNFLEE